MKLPSINYNALRLAQNSKYSVALAAIDDKLN